MSCKLFPEDMFFFFQYLYILIKTEGQRTYVPQVESCFSFSQIGQAFFFFWYVLPWIWLLLKQYSFFV